MKWARLQDWLNLFLYATCPLCGRSAAQEICPDCQRQIRCCQLPNPSHTCQELPVFSWGSYNGALKRAIAAFKYDNQPQIARPLGQWLAQGWRSSRFSQLPLTVVPIPLHHDRQKQRGYNQATLLAHSFCALTGLPLRCYGLERLQKTQAQFRLSPAEQEQNLSQAFVLGKDFSRQHPAHPVLLLDDIYTTGATARSAVNALQRSGIPVYGIATLAFAEQLKVQKFGKGNEPTSKTDS